MPHVKQWHERYARQGLVVVGVHTPEFAYEADPARVKNFLQENGITHPVVPGQRLHHLEPLEQPLLAGDVSAEQIWRGLLSAFRQGRYAKTEAMIRQLIAE